jgi:hypothetical protein
LLLCHEDLLTYKSVKSTWLFEQIVRDSPISMATFHHN